MSKEPRKILDRLMEGITEYDKFNKEPIEAFFTWQGIAYKPGAIDTKTKELMSVAICVSLRSEQSTIFHTYKALQAGANRDEVQEAAMLGVYFGGNPSMNLATTVLSESIDEFEKDFKH